MYKDLIAAQEEIKRLHDVVMKLENDVYRWMKFAQEESARCSDLDKQLADLRAKG
jgi:hypothetical protein